MLYQAEPAGRVEVEYIDQTGGISLTARVRVSSTAEVRFEQSTQASSAGGSVTITVVDRDGETGHADPRHTSVNVSVVGSPTPSTTVVLKETGGSTGVYTGAVQTTPLTHRETTVFRPSCPHTTSFVTAVSTTDSIRAVYADLSARGVNGESSGAPILVSSVLSFSSATGAIQMTSVRSPLQIGDSVTITVYDSDLNADPTVPESNLAGLVRVYGHGWGCAPASYSSCATSQLADGSRIFRSCSGFVPLNSTCLNPTPPCPVGVDQVTSESCAKADWEEVPLTETGCNTGVYTGIVATSAHVGAAVPEDNRLYVRSDSSGSTQLRAVYLDQNPAGSMRDAYLGVQTSGRISSYGSDADSTAFSVGEVLTITVTDGDANLDSCSVESIHINVTASRGSGVVDKERVRMLETGVSTGVFTAHLDTAATPDAPGTPAQATSLDGALTHLELRDIVQADYFDSSTAQLFQHASLAADRGDISRTFGMVLAGGTLHITVVDADLNTDDENVGEIVSGRLRVTTNKDSEVEELVLKESVSHVNTFVAILNTDRSSNRGRANSGTLNVMQGNRLTVTYTDLAPAAIRTTVIRVATAASLSVSPSLPAAGEILSVTLTDSDLNLDPERPDSGVVQAYRQPSSPLSSIGYVKFNGPAGPRPPTFGIVQVTETALSSNVFTGALLLSERQTEETPTIEAESRLSKTGEILWSTGGDTLTLTYADEFPREAARVNVPLNARARLHSSRYIESGQNLTITVTDADMNQDLYAAERIEKASEVLWVETDYPTPGDKEYLGATETGVDTGIFTAVVPTSNIRSNERPQLPLNDIIEPLVDGYYVDATYIDLAPRGNSALRVRASTIGKVTVSSLGSEPGNLGAGSTLYITLDDPDMNWDLNKTESAVVVATTSKGGEGSERIALTEMGSGTAMFTGLLKTRRSALLGPDNDGEMNLIDGDFVTVTYTDESPKDQNIYVCRDSNDRCTPGVGQSGCGECYNPRQAVAQMRVFGRVYLELDPANSLQNGFSIRADAVLNINTLITVTVIDSDLNKRTTEPAEIYAEGKEYSPVVFARSKGREDMPLEMAESSADSSVFTGVFLPNDDPSSTTSVIVGAGPAASSLVTVEYRDPTGGTRTATARLQTEGELSISSSGSSSKVRVGESLTVTVLDGDRDHDFENPDELTVVVKSHTESDLASSESLTLRETNYSSGVFTGTMQTSLGEARVNGMIDCEMPQDEKACFCNEINGCSECVNDATCTCQSAYVSVEYADPSPEMWNVKAALALTFPGTIAFSAAQGQPGQAIDITVKDADLNTDAATSEVTSVTVSCLHSSTTSSTVAAQTSIVIRESGLSSSSFTARVSLCEGCTSNTTALNIGSQSIGVKRTLVAHYQDSSHFMDSCAESCDHYGKCLTSCTSQPAERRTEAAIMTLGVLQVSALTASASALDVTLHDLNADTSDLPETMNVALAATVTATPVSCGSDCQLTLQLMETGSATGAFTGSVPTQRHALGCTLSSSTICSGIGNDALITLSYSDALPSHVVSLPVKMVCDAVVSLKHAFAPGRDLTITIADCDMDTSPAPDNVTVTVRSSSGSGDSLITDTELVTLTETAAMSGFAAVFTGRLSTTAANVTNVSNLYTANDGNGVLYIRTSFVNDSQPSTISVSYTDTYNSAGSSQARIATSKACSTARLNVSQTVNGVMSRPTPEGLITFTSGVLSVRVEDQARDDDPRGVDNTEIAVIAADGSDIETLLLTENGVNTSVFTGVIGIDATTATSKRNDGALGPFTARV